MDRERIRDDLYGSLTDLCLELQVPSHHKHMSHQILLKLNDFSKEMIAASLFITDSSNSDRKLSIGELIRVFDIKLSKFCECLLGIVQKSIEYDYIQRDLWTLETSCLYGKCLFQKYSILCERILPKKEFHVLLGLGWVMFITIKGNIHLLTTLILSVACLGYSKVTLKRSYVLLLSCLRLIRYSLECGSKGGSMNAICGFSLLFDSSDLYQFTEDVKICLATIVVPFIAHVHSNQSQYASRTSKSVELHSINKLILELNSITSGTNEMIKYFSSIYDSLVAEPSSLFQDKSIWIDDRIYLQEYLKDHGYGAFPFTNSLNGDTEASVYPNLSFKAFSPVIRSPFRPNRTFRVFNTRAAVDKIKSLNWLLELHGNSSETMDAMIHLGVVDEKIIRDQVSNLSNLLNSIISKRTSFSSNIAWIYRAELVNSLYCHFLYRLLLKEVESTGNTVSMQIENWLFNELFQKSLIVSSLQIVCHVYNVNDFDFKDIISNVELCKVLGCVIVSDSYIPRLIKDYIDHLEVELLLSYIWREDTLISLMKRNITFLREQKSTLDDSSAQNGDQVSIIVFLKKIIHIVAHTLRVITAELSALRDNDASDDNIFMLFRYVLVEHIDLLSNIHCDTILLCAVYSFCRVRKVNLSFKAIVAIYTNRFPHNRECVIQMIGKERLHIFSFYNRLFVPEMKYYLLDTFRKNVESNLKLDATTRQEDQGSHSVVKSLLASGHKELSVFETPISLRPDVFSESFEPVSQVKICNLFLSPLKHKGDSFDSRSYPGSVDLYCFGGNADVLNSINAKMKSVEYTRREHHQVTHKSGQINSHRALFS